MKPKNRKTSQIWLFLFGKPAWEIDLEGQEVDDVMLEALEKLGDELKERLLQITRVTRILLQDGWSASGGLYDIWFFKDVDPERARKELLALGLGPDDVQVEEEERDEDEE